MEVTRTNYQDVLKEIDDILKDATFLGIDGEFTGLNSGPDAGAFDTPAQYYAKLRSGSMDFLLVQFGLSVFTYNKETDKYSQRSYNFYVFPRPLNRGAPDCRFMCQASCISFLANQGFDFNKLFKLGIPYLTCDDQEKLNKRLEERQKARDESVELIPISDDDKPYIEDICGRIEEFLTSNSQELVIERCNSYIRRLIYQETKIRWPNKIRVESKSENIGYSLVIQKAGTKEEEEQREVERREKEKQEIEQAAGISILLRKIADSGKLIVGHNMLLDLCHIIHQFFAPLPESYREFKCLVHGLFPRLLDTKVICQSQQFKESVSSSNLNVLLETVSKAPFSIPEVESVEGRSYSTKKEKTHEAGYDAYITGLCFIALSNYLGTLQKPSISMVLSDSALLNPFLNKLLIARLKDFPYINLVGKDPNPSREHVFHLVFPKEWKHSDLLQLFSPFGGIYVSWLSDTSAYVGLNRRDQASSVIQILGKAETYKIQKYVDHQASLEGNNDVERKRKLSSVESANVGNQEKISVNHAKTADEDCDGWHTATGNENKLSSEPVIPTSYPYDRSRGTPRTRGTGHEVVEPLLLEQIKVTQKVRLKNTLSLPADFRNGKGKDKPKYIILRRNTSQDLETIKKIDTIESNANDLKLLSSSDERLTIERNNEPNDNSTTSRQTAKLTCETKAISDSIINSESIRTPPVHSSKSKQHESLTNCNFKRSLSPKKSTKANKVSPTSSPSAKAKMSPKKHTKTKHSNDHQIIDRSEKSESISKSSISSHLDKNSSNNKLRGNSEKQIVCKDDHGIRKRISCHNADDKGKIELRKPSLKLLKTARKRSESVSLTGSLIVKLAQVAGVLFLLYFIIEL